MEWPVCTRYENFDLHVVPHRNVTLRQLICSFKKTTRICCVLCFTFSFEGLSFPNFFDKTTAHFVLLLRSKSITTDCVQSMPTFPSSSSSTYHTVELSWKTRYIVLLLLFPGNKNINYFISWSERLTYTYQKNVRHGSSQLLHIFLLEAQ